MITGFPLHADVSRLREQVEGRVVVPGEPDWDDARQAWNLAVDQRPALVVLPVSAADIQTTVLFAREAGLRVAMQGTGHNASPMGPLDHTVLVKTSEMRGVTIDADNRVARVEAGALWLDVTAPASEAGLAALSGSSPDVGVVGYTLGGGLSWLGRRYGLAAERVLAIEAVTADGRLVRADRRNHADLFWALRGGGGSFAAVTALEFELFELPEVYAGMLLWDGAHAAEVIHAWREWTATAPESVTTSIRLMNLPPMPELPEFLRGRSIVVIDGAVVADAAAATEILARLRALQPEMDTFATIPPVGLSYIHMDPEEPMPGMSDSAILDTLPAEAVERMVELAGPGSDSPLLMFELRHIGGALARRGTGALGAFRGEYLMFAGGVPMDPMTVPALEATLALTRAAFAPYGSGAAYLNFAERPTDPVAFYGEETYARLRAVKAAVDPDGLFRGNHDIAA